MTYGGSHYCICAPRGALSGISRFSQRKVLPFSTEAKDICVRGYDVSKVDGELNQLSCFDPRMLKVFFRSGRLAHVADQFGFAISIAVPMLDNAERVELESVATQS